ALVAACASPDAGRRGHDGDDSGSANQKFTRPPAVGANPSVGEAFPVIDTTELDPFFTQKMQEAESPGLSIAVVRARRLEWAKRYGLADIQAQRPVTPNTLFTLASISKTITSVALMQLIEDPSRRLALEEDVSTRLPFALRNPSFPRTPITF